MPVAFQLPEVMVSSAPESQHEGSQAESPRARALHANRPGSSDDDGHGSVADGRASRKSKGSKKPAVVLPRLAWLKVTGTGEVARLHTDKYKIITKLGVRPRDLRLLDPQIHIVSPPAILARESAIVVSLENIKCIITRDHVMIVNPDEESAVALVEDLQKKFRSTGGTGAATSSLSKLSDVRKKLQIGEGTLELPFELKSLEVCFDMIVSRLDAAVQNLEKDTLPVLDSLTKRVSMKDVEAVRRAKNKLVRLKTRVESIHEVLEKFLDDDEDMHRLNLTAEELARRLSDFDESIMPPHPGDLGRDVEARKRAGGGYVSSGDNSSADMPSFHRPLDRRSLGRYGKGADKGGSSSSSSSHSSSSINSQDEAEVAEVEMLLEAYDMHLENTLNRLQSLDEYIKDTEDLVNTGLDQKRNELITVDLIFTSNIVALGLVTTITGIFGMNIVPAWLQVDEGAFNSVAIAASLGSYIMFGIFMWWVWNQNMLSF